MSFSSKFNPQMTTPIWRKSIFDTKESEKKFDAYVTDGLQSLKKVDLVKEKKKRSIPAKNWNFFNTNRHRHHLR